MVFAKNRILLYYNSIKFIRQMQPLLQTYYPRIYLYYNKKRLSGARAFPSKQTRCVLQNTTDLNFAKIYA